MSKVSRNEPCPCGSGKKYKKCCIGKILSFPTSHSLKDEQPGSQNEFMEIVKQHFKENQYNSLEEMNAELGQLSRKFNSLGQDDFLGLSSTQMHNLLYSPLTLDNEIFKIDLESEDELDQVPILNQAVYFLRKLQEVGELKATQKGNLPKLFVIEMYEQFYSKEKYARKPSKEDDLPQVTRLKHLLELSGLIKKRNNKFSLTIKALSILEKNKRFELFELIFLNFANNWNWAYMDRFSELFIIQQSVAFNFLLLHKKCNGWILGKDLGQLFLKAFPSAIREIPYSSYSTPERQVINCFSVRFLNRFCLPLGIVNFKEERIHNGDYFEHLEYYNPTNFFKKNFKFK